MMMQGEVLRWPIPIMPVMNDSGTDIRVEPPVEIQFLRYHVATRNRGTGGNEYVFFLQCVTCSMSNPRKVQLYSSPLYQGSGADIPDEIETWLRDHAEMHRLIGQWGKSLAKR